MFARGDDKARTKITRFAREPIVFLVRAILAI